MNHFEFGFFSELEKIAVKNRGAGGPRLANLPKAVKKSLRHTIRYVIKNAPPKAPQNKQQPSIATKPATARPPISAPKPATARPPISAPKPATARTPISAPKPSSLAKALESAPAVVTPAPALSSALKASSPEKSKPKNYAMSWPKAIAIGGSAAAGALALRYYLRKRKLKKDLENQNEK